MPNYQNGKIYKLYDITTGEQYIGSTTTLLYKRLSGHVGTYKRYLNNKCRNITSFKIIEGGNYRIELIEAYPCNTKEELHKREGYHIKQLDCVNKCIPGRKRKEYYWDNVDKEREDNIEYYNNNKSYFKDYYKDYYQTKKEHLKEKIKCECGGLYRRDSRYHHNKTKKHLEYTKNQ